MCQDAIQLILHSVDLISGTVCGHTKMVHAGIRLNGRNLSRQVWSMIDDREISHEACRQLQVMEVSIKIPHDMRFWKGPATFCVLHLLYLGRAKRQIIGHL